MNGLPAVVVGIDGSKAGIHAALWAVDEAVSRDIPLRLLYAIEPGGDQEQPPAAAHPHATADIAVRAALTALEASDKPAKIEVDIVADRPVSALIRASASATMLCVGAVGLHHFQPGRVGSTAAALAASARCPVAIVRGNDDRARRDAHWIVVEAHGSPGSSLLLEAAVEEALLRKASLRAITCWQSGSGEVDEQSAADDQRRAHADLDRRLARWTRRYPDLRVESLAVHGSLLDYLANNDRSVQLVVAGADDRQQVGQLVGPSGSAVLQHADCSVLIVDRRYL